MKLVSIEDIEVPEKRQRKEIEPKALNDLEESISSRGLIQPIVVEGKGAEKYVLIAGGRRLQAVRNLNLRSVVFFHGNMVVPPGEIPVVHFSDLDEIQRLEIELDENIVRVDLPWRERTLAIAELHDLRKKQNKDHTKKETINEVVSKTGMNREVAGRKLANAFLVRKNSDIPGVKEAKSEREAINLIHKKLSQDFSHKLLLSEKQKSGRKISHNLILGDTFQELDKFEEETFDLILTDPPYGYNVDKYFPQKTVTKHNYEDSEEYSRSCLNHLLTKAFRILHKKAHIFMFTEIQHWEFLQDLASRMGLSVWRTPIIWRKGYDGYAPWGSLGFSRTYEIIFLACKGQKPLRFSAPDILDFSRVREKTHGAEKPVELFSHLIELSCVPGSKVLDPFCGSGTIFEAAAKSNVRATGIEISSEHHKTTETRLMKILLGETEKEREIEEEKEDELPIFRDSGKSL